MDNVRTVTLGGKPRQVTEPPLGAVRRIVKIYRRLSDAETPHGQRLDLVKRLLGEFFPQQRLGVIGGEEMTEFLNAVPDLCGLEPAKAGAKDDGAKDDGDQAFGAIYAHLAASFGWDYATIDQQVTLRQLRDMADYMKRNPPTHQLVAAYLGYDYQTPEEKLRRFFMQAKARA